MRQKISAVVIAKNEENSLVDCIEALRFCDEIIAIDDYSTDRTLEITKSLKVSVFQHHLNSDFSKMRNFGLEKSTGDWVLFVDADERISNDLQKEIVEKIQEESIDGFFIPREDVIWGRKLKYGEAGNIKLLRLGRRTKGKWKGKVHEVWDIKGKIDYLKNPIVHYPHQTLTEFLDEINAYSSIRAEELFKEKKEVKGRDIIFYPLGKFFVNYFFKRGYQDAVPGLLYAILMSFHSFLVRGKLYLLTKKSE